MKVLLREKKKAHSPNSPIGKTVSPVESASITDEPRPVIRTPEVRRDTKSVSRAEVANTATEEPEKVTQEPDGTTEKRSRYIPVEVQRTIRRRSGGRCEYLDTETRRRCTGRFGLEFDHISPFARGGPSTLENLRHLCANHNRFAAVQAYGQTKMRRYFESGRASTKASGK
jgi:hypothetical protein